LERREELDNIFKDIDPNEKTLITKLIDEVIFLEEEMEKLKKIPFIKVNDKNNAMQKVTPAAKLYKEHSQSYMNAIRILCSVTRKEEGNEESPLRQYLKELKQKYEQC
jgi:hypothetical protein